MPLVQGYVKQELQTRASCCVELFIIKKEAVMLIGNRQGNKKVAKL